MAGLAGQIWNKSYLRQGFWYFARSRSREFQENPQNPAKFARNLPNTFRHNTFESYLGCWGWLLAVNLLIYRETSSPQRVNNITKLPGVLRLMLRKTGKQRWKNPDIPNVDHGNWGWECCILWRITPYTFISPTKMTFSERFGPRMKMHENLQNEQSSCSFSRYNK